MSVYFIAEDENGDYDDLRIKIGLSKNIERRLSDLRTGSPYKLRLMGWIDTSNDHELEKSLHSKYANCRQHLEWFNLSASDVLVELSIHGVNSYIAINENTFEIIDLDDDGVPEYVGPWKWTDIDFQRFCPDCGWGGGLSYNENYCGDRCLKCGFTGD